MNALFVVPHADDEVLLGGGTIAKYIRNGSSVDLIVCMAAESERENHQLECCKRVCEYLKINSFNFLNISSNDLSNNLVYVSRVLEKTIKEYNKDFNALYTISEFDNHQDHRLVFNAINIATRMVGPNKIPNIFSGETISSTDQRFKNNVAFNPTYYNVITRDDLHKKLQAMAIYTKELCDAPHPRSLDIIECYAKVRGSEIMQNYAEAFIPLRQVIS
jgi:LmbE family N-acetylglucosaminyl deacetylase